MTGSIPLAQSPIFSSIVSAASKGTVLLFGPSGSGKTTFAIQFAKSKLEAGYQVIFVLTVFPRADLDATAGRLGLDLASFGHLVSAVDCYSSSSPTSINVPPNATLQEVLDAIEKAAKDKVGYLLVVDDISSLIAYTPPDAAYKFMQMLVSKVHKDRSQALLLIHPEILDSKLMTLCLSMAEGHLEIVEDDKGNKKGRVKMLRHSPISAEWFPFAIDENGIQLTVSEDGLEERIVAELGRVGRIYPSEFARKSNEKTETVERTMEKLTKEGKLVRGEEELKMSCPRCSSLDVEINGLCPRCGSRRFEEVVLIEHYKCGNVSAERDYQRGVCPKCRKEIKLVGVDYRRKEGQHTCQSCGEIFSQPKKNLVCASCGSTLDPSSVSWVRVYGYSGTREKKAPGVTPPAAS
ncbi:MAG: hypothetical protein JRN06_04860 [Nitrososphaerota archaeon]|nr:hypothetical protein [Nitrososphaerota archaeon]MDG7023949.1 hypothetical protein [Nitrososphaerota archaeon]